MRKIVFRLILIAAALFAVLGRPGSRVVHSPLVAQMNAMKRIGAKILRYELDLPATENVDFKIKSMDDLVAANLLTPDDFAYLRDHQVTFHGDDPDHLADDVPLLESVHKRTRIIFYGDGHIATSPLDRAQ